MTILRLAMLTPLRRSFDYLPCTSMTNADIAALQPGCRILAPFGPRKVVGILLAICEETTVSATQLKPIEKILDPTPIFSPALLKLCLWAAQYYQHPHGDVLSNALPSLLRKNNSQLQQTETRWTLTTEGKGLPVGALARAPKQAQLLALLQQQAHIGIADLTRAELNRSHAKSLIDKGLVIRFEQEVQPIDNTHKPVEPPLTLNKQQQQALDHIDLDKGYQCSLLEGITGSGKTEVYLQLIAQCLHLNRQALVLIPEIGLTPQTLARFQRRFNCEIAILHSALTDKERLLAWQAAQMGQARIIIGTRSAVFTPLPELGVIIIDEEHDNSFKQQDGFRYSARDIAIKRCFDEQRPIVLGSATPSLETLNNSLQKRFQHLSLTERAAGAQMPSFQVIDIRNQPLEGGFSASLINAIRDEIEQGNQALVFINRRGFAPIFMCHSCGYVAQCKQCDARLTVHYKEQSLRCHHCEAQWPLLDHCPDCQSTHIDFRGSGTERNEQVLQQTFPKTSVIRIDRDTTSRKDAMQQLIDKVHQGDPCILVGTQMLAKGHHFPDVTLVAILDADGGLFSADFRGPEKMGQLLVQVAGRAGRANKPGRVIVQTHQPEHPLIISLTQNSYQQFARQLLQERKIAGLPPFGYLTLMRAEYKDLAQAERFLADLRQHGEQACSAVQCFGPLPAPMTKKAGQFRAQLLLQTNDRRALNHYLQSICSIAEQHPLAKKIRWSIDVDPLDMF